MKSSIHNKTARELVVDGWKQGLTLKEMSLVLGESGFIINPFAIISTWTTLDETKNLTGEQ